MKPFGLNPKIAAVTAGIAILFFAMVHEARSALVDWAKHEEWRRKQLEALVSEVKLKGSAPYVIMSFREYDSNKDGQIDRNEVSVIEDALRLLPAAKPKK